MASVIKYREQDAAVIDEIVTFLSSPLFQVPILTFSESNCLVFESGTDDCSAYRDIYSDYRKLVGILLDDVLKEADLSHYDVVKCLEAMKNTSAHADLLSVIQEEIVAAENYNVFVRLMVQKNLELQQQALILVMNRTGRSDILQPDSQSSHEDDKILKAVLEQSRLEYEEDRKRNAAELDQLQTILASSAAEAALLEQQRNQERLLMTQALRNLDLETEGDYLISKPIPGTHPSTSHSSCDASHEPNQIASNVKNESPVQTDNQESANDQISKQISPAKSNKKNSSSQPISPSTLTQSVPRPVSGSRVTPTTAISSAQAAANWLESAQSEACSKTNEAQSTMTAEMGSLSESEIKQRQTYLRKQRDILLAMKKKEREKQLEKAQQGQGSLGRIAGSNSNGVEVSIEGRGDMMDSEYERKLAMRKAIAEKVRAELMGQK